MNNDKHTTPCLCDVCLMARDAEIARVRASTFTFPPRDNHNEDMEHNAALFPPPQEEPWVSIEGALYDLADRKATVQETLQLIRKYTTIENREVDNHFHEEPLVAMNTSKVTRVEVIDHTKSIEKGGGRAYVFWEREKEVKIELLLQDDGRTLKVFISPKTEE